MSSLEEGTASKKRNVPVVVPSLLCSSPCEALDDLQADTALTYAVGAGLVENHIYMKRAEVDKTAGLEGDALRDWYIWYL
jgi:glutamine synthetase